MQTCPKHKLAREGRHWPTRNNVAYVTKSFMIAKNKRVEVITMWSLIIDKFSEWKCAQPLMISEYLLIIIDCVVIGLSVISA